MEVVEFLPQFSLLVSSSGGIRVWVRVVTSLALEKGPGFLGCFGGIIIIFGLIWVRFGFTQHAVTSESSGQKMYVRVDDVRNFS